ncbi:HIT domain-containing protein [Xanthobacter autotrophicus DSM 431]|uniref:HIT family protein n=1 Tax=Xanthobacter nonsaccharivorans TaxID=3119912 RepID=UPI0037290F92
MTSHTAPFLLDPRLEADGPAVGNLPLCQLRLVDDARFFWVVLVPRRAHMVEIIDLPFADRLHLMEEVAVVSSAVRESSGCAKLNVAALGNLVPQLHVHIVGRDPGDAAWPGPVFGVGTREPLADEARDARLAALRVRLAIE